MYYICGMETEDKISFNYTDGLIINDNVYEKVIKDFNILYERDKMGGNIGIHFSEQDPPFQLDPKSWKKIFGKFWGNDYLCKMEPLNDYLLNDYTTPLEYNRGIYGTKERLIKLIKEKQIKKIRELLGGNEGIHLPNEE